MSGAACPVGWLAGAVASAAAAGGAAALADVAGPGRAHLDPAGHAQRGVGHLPGDGFHQLGRGPATDEARLYRMCLARADEREFFIRKAIGWALRDYAWRYPDAVDAFVSEHRAELSALTIREATKNLEKARAAPLR